ncbi:hypothetical protein BGZ51_004919 [Haplosporangium sp. Z 767]|nr:hypothetical protein BGZ51_004919 [Haplosporangium sp. Z 767]KAF9196356.1 hypothetical protein BGZ50_000758 [Haplosporangium sp. Z 11]
MPGTTINHGPAAGQHPQVHTQMFQDAASNDAQALAALAQQLNRGAHSTPSLDNFMMSMELEREVDLAGFSSASQGLPVQQSNAQGGQAPIIACSVLRMARQHSHELLTAEQRHKKEARRKAYEARMKAQGDQRAHRKWVHEVHLYVQQHGHLPPSYKQFAQPTATNSELVHMEEDTATRDQDPAQGHLVKL